MEANLKKLRIFLLGLGIVAIFLLAACAQSASTNTSQSFTFGPGSGSFITVNSIAELTNKSKLIVIGQVVKIDDIVNMARDINDPSKPDNQVYVVGQVYQVNVKKFLKGSEAETIFVVQREGFLGESEAKTKTDIQKAKSVENFIPMGVDKEYLMFLKPMLGFPDGKYYVGVAQPWRFAILDATKVVPESPWEGASQYFPQMTLENFISQMDQSELLTSPYPPPSTPTSTPTSQSSPYP
jgi:hypothetical protein